VWRRLRYFRRDVSPAACCACFIPYLLLFVIWSTNEIAVVIHHSISS